VGSICMRVDPPKQVIRRSPGYESSSTNQ
jgi:hypothetical protein